MNNFAKVKPHLLELVFTNLNTRAKIIEKATGNVVASATTNIYRTGNGRGPVNREAEGGLSGSDKAAAARIGAELAERAKAASVEGVQWLRPKRVRYHGKVKSLIESMKEAGIPLV
mmetsp:Transcript_28803/g.91985  ORF Transcript_28803/g.91985 Transcript_28803/m.91985 type:complete len:116 (-) Transcript_28803:17-364(-)